MERSLPKRGRKRPNSPHPAIIPESSRFGLVPLAVTLLFLWAALTQQTILRLHHSNHTRLRSGGLKVFYEEQHPETKAGKAGGLGKALSLAWQLQHTVMHSSANALPAI